MWGCCALAAQPTVFCPLGLAAWEEYPTLKMLMEMVMTKYVHALPRRPQGGLGPRAAPETQLSGGLASCDCGLFLNLRLWSFIPLRSPGAGALRLRSPGDSVRHLWRDRPGTSGITGGRLD